MRRTVRILAILMAVSFAYGCGPNVRLPDYRNTTFDNTEEPETLSGIYEVHFYETENTCFSDENRTPIDTWIWMVVITQEQSEDGGFIVNINVAGLWWFMAEITPNGVINALEGSSGEPSRHIVGTLTPEEVVATITLNSFPTNADATPCHVIYEIQGYLLFERATQEEEDQNSEEIQSDDSEHKPISGIYEIRVIQTFNACDGSMPWRVWTQAAIVEQEQREDSSYLVDIFLDLWTAQISLGNLEVDTDGTINIVFINCMITGTLTQDQIDFSIGLYFWTEESACAIFFEVDGHPLYERAELPEDFEDR